MKTKFCNQCGTDKAASEFSPRRQSNDGLRPECKDCRNRRSRSHYANNIEIERKKAANKARRRYSKDSKVAAAKAQAWRRKRAKPKKPKQTIEERLEKKRVAAREYQKKYPEKIRILNRNRRARSRAAQGSHTAEDIAWLRQIQKCRCAHSWCRRPLGKFERVDHVIALSRGGSNDRKNLQLLCEPCNLKKHAKHPIDFAQQNGMLL